MITLSDELRRKMDEQRIIREAIEDGSYCPTCKTTWSNCDCDPEYESPERESDTMETLGLEPRG